MDYELTEFDRINVIKDTINKYGEDNFYLSFSGGKDSTILHYLIDLALPNNRIPRVYINTGIEYQDITSFVLEMAKNDDRFVILKPTKPIKQTLEKYGYPFKSKEHSYKINLYKKGSKSPRIMKYKNNNDKFSCPSQLKYQFEDSFTLNISNMCCNKLKKEPIHKWQKENKKTITITGMRNEEGGQRANIKGCIITDNKGKVLKFHPLIKINEEWENWFIEKHKIKLCRLYYSPFSFKRTGCKGCPYSLELNEQLEMMSIYLPNEKKQCELIWKPIYDEYRRIGYRLKKNISLWE